MITAVIAVKLIPLWSSTGVEDSLYDEVVPSSSDNTPLSNNELFLPDKGTDVDKRRLSAASGYYELVEVKHEVCTVDGNYTWIVDEGPRPKSSSNSRADPAHVDNSSTLADVSTAVIDSNGTAEGQDEDGAPLFKIVTPRRTEKKVSTKTDVAWISYSTAVVLKTLLGVRINVVRSLSAGEPAVSQTFN